MQSICERANLSVYRLASTKPVEYCQSFAGPSEGFLGNAGSRRGWQAQVQVQGQWWKGQQRHLRPDPAAFSDKPLTGMPRINWPTISQEQANTPLSFLPANLQVQVKRISRSAFLYPRGYMCLLGYPSDFQPRLHRSANCQLDRSSWHRVTTLLGCCV